MPAHFRTGAAVQSTTAGLRPVISAVDETVSRTGLGLAIAPDIAEACGGWITLTRTSIGGLAATVFLPGDSAVNRSTIVL